MEILVLNVVLILLSIDSRVFWGEHLGTYHGRLLIRAPPVNGNGVQIDDTILLSSSDV